MSGQVSSSFFGKKQPVAPAPVLRAGRDKLRPPQAAPAPTDEDDDFGVDDGGLQLDGSGSGVDPRLEQAAICFAAGHADAARAVLEEALQHGDAPEEAWFMLLELCEFAGDRQRFDALALEFAARFEKSPLDWKDPGEAPKSSSAAAGRAVLLLTGSLDAKAAQNLGQLPRMAAGKAAVRIDLAKLRQADAAGCALLLAALRELRGAGCVCLLSGVESLLAVLAGKVHAGQREDEAIWELLFELYQRQGLEPEFEALALSYALTFECSPPSWRPTQNAAAAPAAAAAAPLPGHRLNGEIVNVPADYFASLLAPGEGEALVDAAALRRIDFVSAGILLNTVIALQKAGRRLRIRHLSHLVAALLTSVGLDRLAVLETKNN